MLAFWLFVSFFGFYVGIIAGSFLERNRVVKTIVSESDPPVYYQVEDLFIGCKIQIHKYDFILIDADEYALRYMEKHKEQVPMFNA